MAEIHPHWLRLMHLVSPSLPTGAFAYSQGLEWAIETGWVSNGAQFEAWLSDLLQNNMAYVDLPVLVRMYHACRNRNAPQLTHWVRELVALRETRELRAEEQQRGRAMLKLLKGLEIPIFTDAATAIAGSQLAGFAVAAVHWGIPLNQAATGYAWSWLENQVIAGIKTIPLGQTRGHRILTTLDPVLAAAVDRALDLPDAELGAAGPAMAMASALHETQYSRLYRS